MIDTVQQLKTLIQTWLIRFSVLMSFRFIWWFTPQTWKELLINYFTCNVMQPSALFYESTLLKISELFATFWGVHDSNSVMVIILLTLFCITFLSYQFLNTLHPMPLKEKETIEVEKTNKHYKLDRSQLIVMFVLASLFVLMSLRLINTSFLLDLQMSFEHFIVFAVLLLLIFVFTYFFNKYVCQNTLKKAIVLQTFCLSISALTVNVLVCFFSLTFISLLITLLIASLVACSLSFAINDYLINKLISNVGLTKNTFNMPYKFLNLSDLEQDRLIEACYYNMFIAFLSITKFSVLANLWLKPCLLDANYNNTFVLLLLLTINVCWLLVLKKFIQIALLYASGNETHIFVCVPFVPWLMFIRSIIPLIKLIYEPWQHYKKLSNNLVIVLLNTFAHPIYHLTLSDVLLLSVTQRSFIAISGLVTACTSFAINVIQMGRVYSDNNYANDVTSNAPKIIDYAKNTHNLSVLQNAEKVEVSLQNATLLKDQDRMSALNDAKLGSAEITKQLLKEKKCLPINWADYKHMSTGNMVEILEQCNNN